MATQNVNQHMDTDERRAEATHFGQQPKSLEYSIMLFILLLVIGTMLIVIAWLFSSESSWLKDKFEFADIAFALGIEVWGALLTYLFFRQLDRHLNLLRQQNRHQNRLLLSAFIEIDRRLQHIADKLDTE